MFFLVVWAVVLAVVALTLNAWRLEATESLPADLKPGAPRKFGSGNELVRWLGLAGCAVLLGGFCWLIEAGEDFAYYDDDQYTEFSLRGISFRPPIWPQAGRFFPLGLQEFNLLRFVSRSIEAYHAVAIAELIVVTAIVFVLLDRYPLWLRALITFLQLATPSIAISFLGLSFPERNLILFLCLMLLGYRSFLSTGKRGWFLLALGAAHFALYYKEPTFVLLGAFAGIRLVVIALTDDALRRQGLLGFLRRNAIDVGVLALSTMFLVLYAAWVLPHSDMGYSKSRSIGAIPALSLYLTEDPWLSVLVLTCVARAAQLVRTKTLPDVFWDPLAVAALLYFAVYVKLAIFSNYYTAPVDFIAALYVARLLFLTLAEPSPARSRAPAFALLAAGVLVVAYNLLGTVYATVERKAVIGGRMRIVELLKAEAARGEPRHVGLFFPGVRGYDMMLAASFMQYKGLAVASSPDESPSTTDFVLRGPQPFPGDKCVDYRPDACFTRAAAQPGDLVVVMPEAKMSASEIRAVVGESAMILQYKPIGQLALAALLRAVGRPVPDHFLESMVYRQATPPRLTLGANP